MGAVDVGVRSEPEMAVDAGAASTLADLLARAAERFGDDIAVVANGVSLTYADVDRMADTVALRLGQAGVGRGDYVVLCMHKTAESFSIVHGILRCGAVLVPVDPLSPVTNIIGLVEATDPRVIIADQASQQRSGFGEDRDAASGSVVLVTDAGAPSDHALWSVSDAADSEGIRSVVVEPEDPAYVIFTSGSTGVPKGITHTHQSGLAYARLAVEAHGITASDRLAGLPPLHFDMSTLELYAAPLAGASIVPVGTAELRFPATFTERAANEQVTIWYSVPFQLRQIGERGALDQRDTSALRQVIYAGEPFSAPALASLMDQLPGVRFTNAYGPAETNVVTIHHIEEPPTGPVPIGRPWGNVDVLVADPDRPVAESGDLVDVGDDVLGELWVKAESTMDAYLGLPVESAQRLVVDGDARWYRTGDLVRRDSDGVLTLAGRTDHQVKVRGTRLELESIEAVMAAHPQVADAVVAPDLGGDSVEHLIAAVTLDSTAPELDLRSLRRWCAQRVAQVAVPLDVAVWDAFPLTSSGKIDRQSIRSSLNASGTDLSTNGSTHV